MEMYCFNEVLKFIELLVHGTTSADGEVVVSV